MRRDMTRAQFYAALARNGFGKPILGCWVKHKDIPNISFGLSLNLDGTTAYRFSIARLIRLRNAELTKPQ